MLFAVHLFSFGVFCFFLWKIAGSFVNSMVERVRESLEEVIFEQVGYLIYYHRNMKTLRTEVEKLGIIKKDVEHSVLEARNNEQRIGDGVYSWLKTVDQINEEVKRLEDEATVNKSWLNGWCRDLISRYSLSWEAKKKTQDVIGLQKDNTRLILADFESRIKVMNEIMAALKDDKISAIGICGLGGVGKTTMVEKICKRAKAEKLFNQIVMTVVSQNADPKRIRDEIAQSLGLSFEEKDNFLDRADKLRNKLMDGQRRLVILDDVWEPLDLKAIGIPFGGVYMSCKVMLTSRIQDVCNGMKKNFTIRVLPEQEAWKLFKEKAGNSIEDSPNLYPTAKKVVKECGGLPIAIATVGAALKGKEVGIWEDALSQLKMHIPENISGLTQYVYRSIELSYNFLESQEAKSCLLLCCLFEEDTNIECEDLFKYGMGLGLFKGINAVAEARKRVGTLVDKLKGCYLLLGSEWEEHVKVRVHDVVRDVIRFKVMEGKEAFKFGDSQQLKEWATKGTDGKYSSVTSASLILNSNKIHEQLACPKLDLLLLEGQCWSRDKVNDLFEGMIELKVLGMTWTSVPSSLSLSFLTKLRPLCLHCCELENISLIGELKTLIILSFSYSFIEELPSEIGNLVHLKLLDLTGCFGLKRISPGVISRLKQLEELYLLESNLHWVVGGERKQENEVNLEELGSLSNLIALQTCLPTPNFPGSNSLFKNLLSFWIHLNLGNDGKWRQNEFENDDTRIPIYSGINELLTKTNVLHLEPADVKKVSYFRDLLAPVQLRTLEIEFPQLRDLHFEDLPKIKSVFPNSLATEGEHDITIQYKSNKEVTFPSTELFELLHNDIVEWKRLFQLSARSLRELQRMHVRRLNKLLNVVPSDLLQGLSNLEMLTVEDCASLVEVFEVEGLNIEESDIVVLTKLKELRLNNLPELRHILKREPKGTLFFQSLSVLYVCNCNSLRNLLSTSMAKSVKQLQKLTILNCKMMEEIVRKGENEEECRMDKITMPQLESLTLWSLPNLTSFYQGCYAFELPLLEHVTINDCYEMETFTFGFLSTPKLEQVKVLDPFFFWSGDLNNTIQAFAKEITFLKYEDQQQLEVKQEIGQQEHFDGDGDDNTDDNEINQEIGQQDHLDDVGDGNDDDSEIDLSTR